MKTSQETDKIYPAFLKMQRELGKAKKSSDNPFFKSKYADLASVHEACEDAMIANGFGVTQGHGLEPVPHLYTRLIHASGQWFESAMPLILVKQDAQALGSFTTYARRYALVAMLNMLAEDDDGNAASHKPEGSKTLGGPTAKKASAASKNEIKSYLDSGLVKMPDWWEAKKKVYKIKGSEDLDEGQALTIIAELKAIEMEAIHRVNKSKEVK